MTRFKYQEQFAQELIESWINGNLSHVRTTIHNLKNKAQAAYIAAYIAAELTSLDWRNASNNVMSSHALAFTRFMHPNN